MVLSGGCGACLRIYGSRVLRAKGGVIDFGFLEV